VLIAFLSPSLEDPLLPIIMFSVVGMGWVMLSRQNGSPRQQAHETPLGKD
jgi:hypothetical protein